MRKLICFLLAALMLLALPALAEAAEPASFVAGAYAVRGNGAVYAAIPDGDQTVVLAVGDDGGAASLVERTTSASELVMLGDSLYYLRTTGGLTDVRVRAANGGVSTLYTFPSGSGVHGLSAYQGNLYVLVDNQLHVIYPDSGLCLKLVGEQMGEYAIVDGYAYYVSMTDRQSYTTASLLGGSDLEAEGGCLYRMNMTEGSSELLVKVGVVDVKYGGGRIWFHNLSDAYVMGSNGAEWMEGRLYAYNLATNDMQRIVSDYDWGFYPSDDGAAVYSANLIRFYPISGATRDLYTPANYVRLAGDNTGLIAYDAQTDNVILIAYDGAISERALGDVTNAQVSLVAASTDTATESASASGSEWAVDTTKENTSSWFSSTTSDSSSSASSSSSSGSSGKSSSSGSSSSSSSGSSSSGKDSSYIFPNSSTKKLTEAQVRALDPSMLGYARNEIYARHGYEFKNGAYRSYFNKKSWYVPGGFSENDLNDIEWYNMALIRSIETGGSSSGSSSGGSSSGGSSSSSGKDSSYIFPNSSTQKLTEAQILALDRSMWGYARNEIYARHGYEFQNSSYRNYFSKKSWYVPGGFSEGDLNDIEWYNMKLIKSMEDKY